MHWYILSKYQADANFSPPSIGALRYKIFKCHFVRFFEVLTNQMINEEIQMLNLLTPKSYGCELKNNLLVKLMTDNLPAPIEMIELLVRT